MSVDGFAARMENDVGVLCFQRPPANLLNNEIFSYIGDSIEAFGKDPSCRVIYLKSAIPGVFSMGIDPEFVVKGSIETRKDVFRKMGGMLRQVFTCGLPIFAEVTGPAMAGGAVLAALADFVSVDAAHGKLSFSEVKVKLPIPGVLQRYLETRVAPGFLADMTVLGRNFSADQMVAMGFAGFSFNNETEKDGYRDDLFQKIRRLDRSAMAETLRIRKEPFLPQVDQFLTTIDGPFSKFLGEDYIVAGLKPLIGG